MKLYRYHDFLLEKNEDNYSRVFISDKFLTIIREILKKRERMDENIQLIYDIYVSFDNARYSDIITLIDTTDKNDRISYTQSNRLVKYCKDNNINSEYIDKRLDKYWNIPRTPNYSFGRWVRHYLKDVLNLTFNDKDVEELVNDYKSIYDIIFSNNYEFKLVKGEEIRENYLVKNYLLESGQLGNSCMRYEKCQKYLNIYIENPNVCSLLVMKSGDKVKGRALVWKLEDGKTFMDRVYTIYDSDVKLFENWASTNNIDLSRSSFTSNISVKLEKSNFDFYPYMDTLKYLNRDENTLSNTVLYDEKSIVKLEETTGHFTEMAGDDSVWSHRDNCYYNEEDARYCSDIDDYLHYDDTTYLDYKDEYVSNSADIVYSEYKDGYYYLEDVYKSEYLGDFIPEDEVVTVIMNENGDTDYLTSYYDYLYIREDDKFYFKLNYKYNPYTKKYGFIDRETITKLKKEFSIYKKDGDFDFEKFRNDLLEMLEKNIPDVIYEKFINYTTGNRWSDRTLKQIAHKDNIDEVKLYYKPLILAWFTKDFLIDRHDGTLSYQIIEKFGRLIKNIIGKIKYDSEVNPDDVEKFYHDYFRYTNIVINFSIKVMLKTELNVFNDDISKRILFLELVDEDKI